MKIIFGLGNPGDEYANTRHNIGFEIANEVAKRFHAKFRRQGLRAEIANFDFEEEPVFLMKPRTYMNQSGLAVVEALESFKSKLNARKDLLIVLDDLSLPLGKIRLRASGSAGGHQGLNSILSAMETKAIPRLRVGIGGSGINPMDWSDFVLEQFSSKEMRRVKATIKKSADACEHWLKFGLESAMQHFNAVSIKV